MLLFSIQVFQFLVILIQAKDNISLFMYTLGCSVLLLIHHSQLFVVGFLLLSIPLHAPQYTVTFSLCDNLIYV